MFVRVGKKVSLFFFFSTHSTTRAGTFILPSKLHFASTSAGNSRGFGGRRNDMKHEQERNEK
jgi:hypothetical protein